MDPRVSCSVRDLRVAADGRFYPILLFSFVYLLSLILRDRRVLSIQ